MVWLGVVGGVGGEAAIGVRRGGDTKTLNTNLLIIVAFEG